MKILVAIDQSKFWKEIVDVVGSRPFPPDTEVKILAVLKYAPFDWSEQSNSDWKKITSSNFQLLKHAA